MSLTSVLIKPPPKETKAELLKVCLKYRPVVNADAKVPAKGTLMHTKKGGVFFSLVIRESNFSCKRGR